MDKERLIIGGIDFDQRLDDAKFFIHARINSIWINEALEQDRRRSMERTWRMWRECGILLLSNPRAHYWFEDTFLDRRKTAIRFGGYKPVWPERFINLPPQP